MGKSILFETTIKNKFRTIKPCDKCARFITLKFESYMESCLNELSNQQLQENRTLSPYYVQVKEKEVEETKKQIMADDKNKAMFKVHKTHISGDTPPSRPIISGSRRYT